jgi:hypothetical protein
LQINLPASRLTLRLLAAFASVLALSLATAAVGHAEEFSGIDNPNNYECHGHIEAGKHEIEGEEEQQVQYQFACDGPITGYQIESNDEVTGVGASPLVTYYLKNEPLTDAFSCGGELPGWSVNCVGSTKGRGEVTTGQFSIETSICQEPRVNPLLTVTYAYIEKEVVTQAISGPFELGRPWGCKADKYSKLPRLAPTKLPPEEKTDKTKGKHDKKGTGHKGKGKKAKAKAKAKSKKS